MVVRPHAYDTTHNVRSRPEFLREQPIRQRNSRGLGGRWGQSRAAATKAEHRQFRRKPVRVFRPQCVESLHPHFSTQMPRHPASSFGLRTSRTTAKVLKPKTKRRSERATVRGPTQRVDASRLSKLGSPGTSGTVSGQRPKLIAVASGGGVKIDCGPVRARPFLAGRKPHLASAT